MSLENNASSSERLNSFYEKIKEKNNYDDSDAALLARTDEKAAYNASSDAKNYNDIERRERTAKAHRHELINDLIESLKGPLEKEQESKNKFRFVTLIGFTAFFLVIAVATFALLFLLSRGGFTKYSAQVATILITGLFANVVGLAVIIFKYLFDDKNSLLKDMIQLVVSTLKSDDDRYDKREQ